MNSALMRSTVLMFLLVQAGFDAFPPGDLCICTAACRLAPVAAETRDCCGRVREPERSHAPNCPSQCPNCIRVQLPEHDAVLVKKVVLQDSAADHGLVLFCEPLPFLELRGPARIQRNAVSDLKTPQLAAICTVRLLV